LISELNHEKQTNPHLINEGLEDNEEQGEEGVNHDENDGEESTKQVKVRNLLDDRIDEIYQLIKDSNNEL
jgi:hypothetical protein